MIREWLNYLWLFAFSFFYNNSPRRIMGRTTASDEEVPNNNLIEEPSLEVVIPGPSNTEEMALVKAGDSTVREEEVEQTTETTLSERTKDTGNTQMMEKSASFHGEQTSKVVEETGSSTQNVECDAKNELETDNTTQPVPQALPQKLQLPDIYRPLEPVKKFEPLQPFAPLSQIEAPRSFELAKQIEANIQSEYARNNAVTQEASSGATPLTIDSTHTNNLNGNKDINPLDDNVRQFEPIKPLELPEHVNSVSKQYEPLEPFEVSNGSENIENIQPEQSQDVQSITNVDNSEENVASNLQLCEDSAQNEQVESQDVPASSIAPVEPYELRTSTGELYVPVVALEPLNLDDYLKPIVVDTSQNSQAEIKQESIKESLKEIISDLDMYAEKDKELKESLMNDDGREKNLDRQKQCSSRNSQEMLVVRLPSCVSPNRQRPLSLPPENLLSLIKCAQIAQELNKVIQSNGNDDQDENAAPKPSISLEKLFTPAEDAPQILPSTSKKVYASSSFYAKGLHPTMEEQVELAKRISNSLSDISNKTSKGQSMYVNRKKRSVKWVHEGEGEDAGNQNGVSNEMCGKKSPLKLLMNPHGQIQDITSLRRQGYDIEAALSPDVCLEIVKDLNAPKGKGAELFAKRRKRSEKWVVGETNGVKQDNLPDIAAPPLTPHTPVPPGQTNLPTPGYTPETTQRMQHHQKLDEIQEKFTRPRVKLIKSPWDAALETGSVDAAFENVAPVFPPPRGSYVAPVVDSYEQALKTDTLADWRVSPSNGYNDKVYAHNPAYNSNSINRIVDNLQKGVGSVDVYKPKFPQAWNSKPAKQQYCSVSVSSNIDSSEECDEHEDIGRTPSPFPTIPDVSTNPEVLAETPLSNANVIRPVTPKFLKPEETTMAEKRSPSPFPTIPDVTTDVEILEKDIKTFRSPQVHEEQSRPISPFPKIPDVNLNPEIIERDVASLRSTPIPERLKEPDPDDELREQTPDILAKDNKNVEIPFPTIPNVTETLESSTTKNYKPFYKPARKYAPVSLTGKKYPLVLNTSIQNAGQQGQDELKKSYVPEFTYALADAKLKRAENTYSDATSSCIRTLQSELFESQGHFNASRSCSPFPVYVPGVSSDDRNKQEQEQTVMIAKAPPENESRFIEEPSELKDMTNLQITDKDTRKLIDSQQQCFNELKEVKQAYINAESLMKKYPLPKTTTQLEDDNEVKVILDKMRKVQYGFDGVESHTAEESEEIHEVTSEVHQEKILMEETTESSTNTSENIQKNIEEEHSKEEAEVSIAPKTNSISETNNEERHQVTVSTAPKTSSMPENNKATEPMQEAPEEKPKPKRGIPPPVEKPKYRKPPETIIGARPLFGQMNINEEFKKALDRKHSIKYKKSQKETEKSQESYSTRDDQRIKADIASEYTTNEIAQVSTINISENEEIQKIYYQREREYEVDCQTVQEEVIVPSFTTNVRCYTKVNYQEMQCELPPKISIEIHPPQNYVYEHVLEDHQVGKETISEEELHRRKQYSKQEFTSTKEQSTHYKVEPKVSSSTQIVSNGDCFKNSVNQQKFSLRKVDSLRSVDSYKTSDLEEEEEDEVYRKVPVKCLIKSFEQSAMPTLRVKQIRDPLPDVVEKLHNTSRRTSIDHSQSQTDLSSHYASDNIEKEQVYLKQAEKDFENLYYVANTNVASKYFGVEKMQSFNHDENSSFRKYDSQQHAQTFEEQKHYESSGYHEDINYARTNNAHTEDSNSLPRPKPKVAPPSPSPNYKAATVAPTVFIPKESPVSDSSFPTQTTYYPQEPYTYAPSPSTPKVDLKDFQNYNTAPRGWGQTKNVYRPITFDKPRSSYTDF